MNTWEQEEEVKGKKPNHLLAIECFALCLKYHNSSSPINFPLIFISFVNLVNDLQSLVKFLNSAHTMEDEDEEAEEEGMPEGVSAEAQAIHKHLLKFEVLCDA